MTEVKQDVEVNIKKTKANIKEQEISVVENNNDDLNECVNRLSSLQLTQMKSTGGKRNSPAEQATQRKLFPCHLCDFRTDSQSVWDKHLKEQHRNIFTCPFCDNSFRELNIVKKHIFEGKWYKGE